MFNKLYVLFILNIIIVAIINIIAYLYSYQVNLQYFLYFLAFLVIIGFFIILIELFCFILFKIKQKDYVFLLFLFLLIGFFILKFSFFGEYFYFRYENYIQYNLYFYKDFNGLLYSLLNDFRNFNGEVIVNIFKDFLPKQGSTQYYIYNFFQFLSGLYLYRLFSLFSKDKLIIILLVFLYFGIELFFIVSYSITYVNIILSTFIIFLYYLFNLEFKRNIFSYIFFFFSYILLITGRPDFFFLALIIEFLNAYFKYNNIINLKQNILFYVLLIPYYFIVNNYLLNHISVDEGLLGKTYYTSNFWYIFFDKFFGNGMINKFIDNIQVIYNDKLFIFYFTVSIIGLFYFIYQKTKNILFNYLFLIIYSILFFFIVIFIHKEGFISSFFKYFSMIYLIIFILFGLFIIKLFKNIKNNNYKIFLYISLFIFIIYNYNNTLFNYNKLLSYNYNGINKGNLFKKYNLFENKININIYDQIYDKLFWYNTLYKTNFLFKEINNGCKNILLGKFEGKYTPLFIEYKISLLNNVYDGLSTYDCINLIKVSEGNYIKFNNNNNELIKKINSKFNIVKIYDKFIEKDKWLNLYILKRKNAK